MAARSLWPTWSLSARPLDHPVQPTARPYDESEFTMATKSTSTKAASAKAIVEDPIMEKDWTYLQGKAPSDLHNGLAQFITDQAGIDIDPKQVQALLAMHGAWQKSGLNKSRPNYRPRTVESIAKGGATMAERFTPEPEPAKPARRTRPAVPAEAKQATTRAPRKTVKASA